MVDKCEAVVCSTRVRDHLVFRFRIRVLNLPDAEIRLIDCAGQFLERDIQHSIAVCEIRKGNQIFQRIFLYLTVYGVAAEFACRLKDFRLTGDFTLIQNRDSDIDCDVDGLDIIGIGDFAPLLGCERSEADGR